MRSKISLHPTFFQLIGLFFQVCLISLIFESCHSTRPAETKGLHREKPNTRLIQEIEGWIGTPYKYGGESRRGADCSGFVKAVYLEVFGISLPRTSQAMLEGSTGINPDQLKPGDLVFFEISKKNYHVGIYVGERKFAHASEKKGVIYSSMDDPYYQKTFIKAGRFL